MVELALSASSIMLMRFPLLACRFCLGASDQPTRRVRSRRRPAGHPALEDRDLLRWPCPVAGHRAVAQALEDRALVRLDVAAGPEVEAFEHRVAVLFAEHRTDITLEAQPCG